jgi:hypothetical protein
MIIDRSLPCTELEKLHAERKVSGIKLYSSGSLDQACEDAIRDAFIAVHEGCAVYADELVESQITALQAVLADCRAYQEELEEAMEIARYGYDPTDATVPEEAENVAA